MEGKQMFYLGFFSNSAFFDNFKINVDYKMEFEIYFLDVLNPIMIIPDENFFIPTLTEQYIDNVMQH